MRLKYFLWISFLINLALIFTTPAHALEIDSVRFGTHPDKTRLVLELSQPTDFKVFTLQKTGSTPYRIVIDLPAFNWNAADVDQPKSGKILDVRTGNISKSFKPFYKLFIMPRETSYGYFYEKVCQLCSPLDTCAHIL